MIYNSVQISKVLYEDVKAIKTRKTYFYTKRIYDVFIKKKLVQLFFDIYLNVYL